MLGPSARLGKQSECQSECPARHLACCDHYSTRARRPPCAFARAAAASRCLSLQPVSAARGCGARRTAASLCHRGPCGIRLCYLGRIAVIKAAHCHRMAQLTDCKCNSVTSCAAMPSPATVHRDCPSRVNVFFSTAKWRLPMPSPVPAHMLQRCLAGMHTWTCTPTATYTCAYAHRGRSLRVAAVYPVVGKTAVRHCALCCVLRAAC